MKLINNEKLVERMGLFGGYANAAMMRAIQIGDLRRVEEIAGEDVSRCYACDQALAFDYIINLAWEVREQLLRGVTKPNQNLGTKLWGLPHVKTGPFAGCEA